jgi:hypothetical protein
VLFHREPGQVEFVVEELCGDPGMDGYMNEYGGGVMVRESKSSELYFLQEREDVKELVDAEDLGFVSKG